MRGTIKTVRDAEVSLMRKMAKNKDKGKGAPSFNPKKPKSLRIYVSTAFPEWQDTCVQAIKDSYTVETGVVDDVKVLQDLGKHGLIKDKRAMPFVQGFKVKFIPFSCINTSGVNLFCTETNNSIWRNNCLSPRSPFL